MFRLKADRLFILVSLLALEFPALVQASSSSNPKLELNPAVTGSLLGTSALGVGALILFENEIAPTSCRWCGTNGFDTSSRNHLKWSQSKLADRLSHFSGYLLAPSLALGAHAWLNSKDEDFAAFYTDALIISEAALVAALAGSVIQVTSGRERPASHFSPTRTRAAANNTSFVSRHSTVAFALATSSGTVATRRNRPEAPYIWASGLLVAGTTAYLRVASDRHYLTDVLGGAALGSLIGFSLPYFMHDIVVMPERGGVAALLKWKW